MATHIRTHWWGHLFSCDGLSLWYYQKVCSDLGFTVLMWTLSVPIIVSDLMDFACIMVVPPQMMAWWMNSTKSNNSQMSLACTMVWGWNNILMPSWASTGINCLGITCWPCWVIASIKVYRENINEPWTTWETLPHVSCWKKFIEWKVIPKDCSIQPPVHMIMMMANLLKYRIVLYQPPPHKPEAHSPNISMVIPVKSMISTSGGLWCTTTNWGWMREW